MDDITFQEYAKAVKNVTDMASVATAEEYAKGLHDSLTEAQGAAAVSWHTTAIMAKVFAEKAKILKDQVSKSSLQAVAIRFKTVLKQFQLVDENLNRLVEEANHMVERTKTTTPTGKDSQ